MFTSFQPTYLLGIKNISPKQQPKQKAVGCVWVCVYLGQAEGQQASSLASFQILACFNPWWPSSEYDALQEWRKEKVNFQRPFFFYSDPTWTLWPRQQFWKKLLPSEGLRLWSSHSSYLYCKRSAKPEVNVNYDQGLPPPPRPPESLGKRHKKAHQQCLLWGVDKV